MFRYIRNAIQSRQDPYGLDTMTTHFAERNTIARVTATLHNGELAVFDSRDSEPFLAPASAKKEDTAKILNRMMDEVQKLSASSELPSSAREVYARTLSDMRAHASNINRFTPREVSCSSSPNF